MTDFTPWSALTGGILIGASASVLLLLNGKIAGISGIIGGLLRLSPDETSWRVSFVAGFFVGGLLLRALFPAAFGASPAPVPLLIFAGLLVGFGTQLGSGCTSGHGVCGLSRLSFRSLVATVTFMLTGALSAIVARHVFGVGR
jgi:uncharacterized membrane protein YedE/YeeE